MDLKEQGFALKFIRNEGERMVKDGQLTAERLQDVIGLIAVDTEELVDVGPMPPNLGLQMVANEAQSTSAHTRL